MDKITIKTIDRIQEADEQLRLALQELRGAKKRRYAVDGHAARTPRPLTRRSDFTSGCKRVREEVG